MIIDSTQQRKYLPTLWILKIFPLNVLRVISLSFGLSIILFLHDECYRSDKRINGNSIDTGSGVDDDYDTVCGENEKAFQWILLLAWFEVIGVASIGLLYIYVGCKVVNRTRRRVHQRLLELKCQRNAATRRSSSSSSIEFSRYYCHWSIFVRCIFTVTSVCTCCILGGHGAVFRGDFTDAAIYLSDLFDNGGSTTRRLRVLDFNRSLHANRSDDNQSDGDKNDDIHESQEPDDNVEYHQQLEDDIHRPLIEVTTTDVLAGLILVTEEQRIQRLLKYSTIMLNDAKASTHTFNSCISSNNNVTTPLDEKFEAIEDIFIDESVVVDFESLGTDINDGKSHKKLQRNSQRICVQKDVVKNVRNDDNTTVQSSSQSSQCKSDISEDETRTSRC
jgi:hypothetical protein